MCHFGGIYFLFRHHIGRDIGRNDVVALFGVYIANESSGGVDRDIVGFVDRGLEEVWCRLEGLANGASRHQLPKPFEDLR